ncbi:MAG TPA: hypothetical protein VLG71_02630 [Candidatus Limnocylindria bacterium]|nr:hypothetical protein [Candidatus Limnocylindria bacterium]
MKFVKKQIACALIVGCSTLSVQAIMSPRNERDLIVVQNQMDDLKANLQGLVRSGVAATRDIVVKAHGIKDGMLILGMQRPLPTPLSSKLLDLTVAAEKAEPAAKLLVILAELQQLFDNYKTQFPNSSSRYIWY